MIRPATPADAAAIDRILISSRRDAYRGQLDDAALGLGDEGAPGRNRGREKPGSGTVTNTVTDARPLYLPCTVTDGSNQSAARISRAKASTCSSAIWRAASA